MGLEQKIEQKALALGFESCGIIPVTAMHEYGVRIEERIRKVPGSAKTYEKWLGLSRPENQYPWAKSVVVLIVRYGKYRIPSHLPGRIAKFYLVDSRIDPASAEYNASIELEVWMQEQGIRTLNERRYNLTGARWAAVQAGLGIFRRNNFLYTQSGSWVRMEIFLIDRALELVHDCSLEPCPKGCRRCIEACPTGSLMEPYTMLPSACISHLTTWGGRDLPANPYSDRFSGWIYGCDICQDVCPRNHGKWQELEEFPGLAELAGKLTMEELLEMDEQEYRETVSQKLFYVSPDDQWKWKVNILNAMRAEPERYAPRIAAARSDPHPKVREMADWILNRADSVKEMSC